MQNYKTNFFLYFILLIITTSCCISQEISFSPLDSLHSYHIITLKDGTVLKGKLIKKEKRRIEFQDEIIGNTTFPAKEVSSMEKVEPQDHYLITLMNGTVLQGKIISRKENEIIIETSSIGNVTLDISKIKTIKSITPVNMKDGKYWFNSPLTTQYFIAPSAIPMNRGEVYYQNTMLVYNSFRTNITNHFSCIGGVVPTALAFVAPTLSFRVRDFFYVGGGVLGTAIVGKEYAALGYGQCTFGNRNSHLSIGGGYGYMTVQQYYYVQKISHIEVGVVTISGMKRITPKYSVVTENWFAPNEGISLISGGLRLMGEKNNWDFGIVNFSMSRKIGRNNFSLGPIPFLSYMRNL